MATPLNSGIENRKALARANARLGVPVGERVRKLRAVGDQTDHPLERRRSKLERMEMEEEGLRSELGRTILTVSSRYALDYAVDLPAMDC